MRVGQHKDHIYIYIYIYTPAHIHIYSRLTNRSFRCRGRAWRGRGGKKKQKRKNVWVKEGCELGNTKIIYTHIYTYTPAHIQIYSRLTNRSFRCRGRAWRGRGGENKAEKREYLSERGMRVGG